MAENTIGDVLRVDATFSVNAVNTDPTTITFKQQPPNEALTTFVSGTDVEVVNDATGKYHVDVTLNKRGTWKFAWEATGTVVTEGGTAVTVIPPSVEL